MNGALRLTFCQLPLPARGPILWQDFSPDSPDCIGNPAKGKTWVLKSIHLFDRPHFPEQMNMVTNSPPHNIYELLAASCTAQAILWGGSAVAIIDPLNPLLDEDTLLSLLDSAGTEILFALGPQEQPGIWEKSMALAPRAKKLKKIYSVYSRASNSAHPHFDTEMAQESVDPLPRYWLPEASEDATYCHTGGTTGVPKLAVHSHKNHVITALSRNHYSGLEAGEAMINGLPLFHIGGSTLNSLGMFAGGVNVILPTMDGFRNKAVIGNMWRLVEHYRIVCNACVPTSMAAILQVPVADADISSLRLSVSGGSVVPDVVSDGVQQVTGHPLYQIYAMAEPSAEVQALLEQLAAELKLVFPE
jgi:fatty-acyl-CoA synthase